MACINFLKFVFVTIAAILVHKFASILCTGLLSVNQRMLFLVGNMDIFSLLTKNALSE